jgi:hypothetical protein
VLRQRHAMDGSSASASTRKEVTASAPLRRFTNKTIGAAFRGRNVTHLVGWCACPRCACGLPRGFLTWTSAGDCQGVAVSNIAPFHGTEPQRELLSSSSNALFNGCKV